jgi:nicotinamide-nucleotide amidase
MAVGVRRRTKTTVGMAITGVAGPGGGTTDKPVGTVWICIDVVGSTTARRFNFLGDREEIRRRATQSALDMLRRTIG